MAKIVSLIHSHLAMTPRAVKEADALADDGHDVTVLGCWIDETLAARDMELLCGRKWSYLPVVDLSRATSWKSTYYRFKTKIARDYFHLSGRALPDLYGYATSLLLNKAYRQKADLTIAHSEGGMFIAEYLRRKGLAVGVDFEDWFSEDLPAEARIGRPIAQLKYLERTLIQHCTYCLTTSQAMAAAMAHRYSAPLPKVVYNCFPKRDCKREDSRPLDRVDRSLVSLHWFSQTIGTGRGLETLFEALRYLPASLEVHLRGHYPERYKRILDPLIPEKHRQRVFFHDTVPPEDLPKYIADHDIGLALEPSTVLSTDLTVSNKLFQYMEAGLAVIASATAGQREILEQHKDVGLLIPPNDSMALAEAIKVMLNDSEKLQDAKTASISLSSSVYDFSVYSKHIQQTARKALYPTDVL